MSLTLKKTIRQALEANDPDSVAVLAAGDRKVLSALVRLSYDKETLVGWRAIKAAGLVARALCKTDHEFLRDTCRKLLWSLSDESGGIGWSAPELLGEIVSADTSRFADIIPLIAQVYDVEEDVFRAGIVYALARIAETAPQSVAQFQKIIISSLVDKDPLVRVRGLLLLEALTLSPTVIEAWSPTYREKLWSAVSALKSDQAEAWVYKDQDFESVMVGELAIRLNTKSIKS